jgi:dihydroceramidase
MSLAATMGLWLSLLAGGGPWDGWRPATCLPDACFCEAISSGLIRQPINTWSNLAFVIVGGWVLLRLTSQAGSESTLKRVSTRFGWQTPISIGGFAGRIYGSVCIAIGLGSMVYHASLSFVGQWLDVMSMYLLGVFMVLYAAARLKRSVSFRGFSAPMTHTGAVFAVGYLIINLALGLLLIIWPEARRYVFGLLIVIALALEMILQRTRPTTAKPRRLIAALGVYLIAQIIWTLDLNHIVCDPTSLLQGHAVWHVLTAASAGLLYLYYQSDDARD